MPDTAAPLPPPAVVVGIDGSRAGVAAALWALDEAAERDLPLRLVAVSEDGNAQAPAAVASAEAAVRQTGTSVLVETEVLTGSPTLSLLEASRTAAMLCVGAVGLHHISGARGEQHRVGSTASAVVASAHCPVAVVRARVEAVRPAEPGWVVVEVDGTPDSAAVLQFGIGEARLRSAPLRVLGGWQSRFTDVHDSQAVADGNRMVRAQLDRRLSEWRRRYPDLDVRPVAVHGSMLHWLSRHAASIQLVVVGARNAAGVSDLLGPAGLAALHDTDCSVLVVDQQRLL